MRVPPARFFSGDAVSLLACQQLLAASPCSPPQPSPRQPEGLGPPPGKATIRLPLASTLAIDKTDIYRKNLLLSAYQCIHQRAGRGDFPSLHPNFSLIVEEPFGTSCDQGRWGLITEPADWRWSLLANFVHHGLLGWSQPTHRTNPPNATTAQAQTTPRHNGMCVY